MLMTTPALELPRSALPVTSVPMKFPRTMFAEAAPNTMWMPSRFAEITLRAPVVVPPTTLLGAATMSTPL
jgi:hypothetical protein